MKMILNIALIVIDVFLLGVIIINPGASESGTADRAGGSATVSEPSHEKEASSDVQSPGTEGKSASQLQAELFEGGYEDAEDAALEDFLRDPSDKEVSPDKETSSGKVASEAEGSGISETDDHGYLSPSALAESLSTTDKSTIDDFDWFLNLVMDSGMPDDAQFITDPEDVLGDWKCMVITDPANTEGMRSYHFANVHIECLRQDGTDTMSPHIEWDYEMDLEGNEIDESDKDWYLGMGEWSDGWIGNSQAAHNVKLRFYSTGDGRQYAYGGITLPDVKSTGICLVR